MSQLLDKLICLAQIDNYRVNRDPSLFSKPQEVYVRV